MLRSALVFIFLSALTLVLSIVLGRSDSSSATPVPSTTTTVTPTPLPGVATILVGSNDDPVQLLMNSGIVGGTVIFQPAPGVTTMTLTTPITALKNNFIGHIQFNGDMRACAGINYVNFANGSCPVSTSGNTVTLIDGVQLATEGLVVGDTILVSADQPSPVAAPYTGVFVPLTVTAITQPTGISTVLTLSGPAGAIANTPATAKLGGVVVKPNVTLAGSNTITSLPKLGVDRGQQISLGITGFHVTTSIFSNVSPLSLFNLSIANVDQNQQAGPTGDYYSVISEFQLTTRNVTVYSVTGSAPYSNAFFTLGNAQLFRTNMYGGRLGISAGGSTFLNLVGIEGVTTDAVQNTGTMLISTLCVANSLGGVATIGGSISAGDTAFTYIGNGIGAVNIFTAVGGIINVLAHNPSLPIYNSATLVNGFVSASGGTIYQNAVLLVSGGALLQTYTPLLSGVPGAPGTSQEDSYTYHAGGSAVSGIRAFPAALTDVIAVTDLVFPSIGTQSSSVLVSVTKCNTIVTPTSVMWAELNSANPGSITIHSSVGAADATQEYSWAIQYHP